MYRDQVTQWDTPFLSHFCYDLVLFHIFGVQWREWIPSCFITQNQRMAEVGRHVWRLSSPSLLVKQGQLEQVAQGSVQSGFQYLQGLRLHSLSVQPAPEFNHPLSKNVYFLCLCGICCISVHAHCLLFLHWISLRRDCLHLLYSPPSSIYYTHW